ncbi:MAG: hypothetical protein ABEK12_03135 [Candidatus Nanohaloarchaea archaeon]
MDIDDVDFSILKVLRDMDRPLWKKKIHRQLTDHDGGIPRVRDVSVQTIGRRVDDLHERGHVESCIISPSEINRDLIIAFKVTENGCRAVESKREEILREYAFRSGIFRGEAGNSAADTDTLADLMTKELGLDSSTEAVMREYGMTELQTILAVHYLKRGLRERITEEHVDRLADLAREEDRIADLLLDDIVDSDLRQRLN